MEFVDRGVGSRPIDLGGGSDQYLFDAGLSDYQQSEDKQAEFIDRVEALLSREHTIWLSVQKKKDGTGNPGSK